MGLQKTVNDTFLISQVDKNTDELVTVYNHLEAMRKFNVFLKIDNDDLK